MGQGRGRTKNHVIHLEHRRYFSVGDKSKAVDLPHGETLRDGEQAVEPAAGDSERLELPGAPGLRVRGQPVDVAMGSDIDGACGFRECVAAAARIAAFAAEDRGARTHGETGYVGWAHGPERPVAVHEERVYLVVRKARPDVEYALDPARWIDDLDAPLQRPDGKRTVPEARGTTRGVHPRK